MGNIPGCEIIQKNGKPQGEVFQVQPQVPSEGLGFGDFLVGGPVALAILTAEMVRDETVEAVGAVVESVTGAIHDANHGKISSL